MPRRGKTASWYIGRAIPTGKKQRRNQGAPLFVSQGSAFARLPAFRPATAAGAARHSAGWACPTVFLFSDALIDIRIGRTTNSAIATTMKFMIEATANTACQSPV